MSDSNRVRVSYVEEVTLGTTPTINAATPMRTARITGETLAANISNVVSNEIRADRMVPDLIQASQQNSGDVNFELSFPLARTFLDQMIGGAMFNAWSMLPYKNNVVADTELANVAAGTGIYTIDAGGATFLAGHIVQASGFTAPANNGVFDVSANTATTVTTSNAASVVDATPAAGATLQVVGFKFASGDLVATASGLTCTTANFLNIGLTVGRWIKIGGTGAAFGFATTANNGFARITAVTANAITLDNLPVGYGVDAGTGKTVKIWFGDTLINGVTKRSFTVEKGFLDLGIYMAYKGMVVSQLSLSLNAQQIVTGGMSFLGTTATSGGATLGAPVAASNEDILSSMASVARLAEAGASLAPTSFAQAMTLQINNNLRAQSGIGQLGLIGIGAGRCDVSGSLNTYFQTSAQYDKYIAGTPTNLNFRTFTPGGCALIATLPNVEFESGGPTAPGGNQDVFAQFAFRAKFDPLTNSQLAFDRFAYYE